MFETKKVSGADELSFQFGYSSYRFTTELDPVTKVPPRDLYGYIHVNGFNFKNEKEGKVDEAMGHGIVGYLRYLFEG